MGQADNGRAACERFGKRLVGAGSVVLRRQRTTSWLIGLVALIVLPSCAAAQPLILSHPKFRPSRMASLQVAAPSHAASCRLLIGSGRHAGMRLKVRLGGPTRIVRWRVGNYAHGAWETRFACSDRQNRSLGSTTTTIVVGRAGRPHGRLVDRGTLRVLHGVIPEMPAHVESRSVSLGHLDNAMNDLLVAADLGSGTPVKVNPCGTGTDVGCFNPCPDSEEIASTRTTGDGVATVVQVVPTRAARANAAADLASVSTSDAVLQEDFSLYRTMWSDLNRCANLPSDLTNGERHSIYEQMACHALYGFSDLGDGNTWDFESWRDNIDWADALRIAGSCGQGYGNVPAADLFLDNHLIKAFDTIGSFLQPNTWLVDNDDGIEELRNVADTTAYGCLIAKGYAAPHWYPREFLQDYFTTTGSDVTDSDVCPPAATKAPVTTPTSPTSPPTTPPPAAPSSVSPYNNYGPANAGHAMCRGNPDRPESMPGGTVTQTLTIPPGVGSIDAATVQIDPDSTVTAHATLLVNGTAEAYDDQAAAGDTHFTFPSVSVTAGDTLSLQITFSASYGKIITVYTAGDPGGTFSASNSCSDGAPNDLDSSTGLRAVISGLST